MTNTLASLALLKTTWDLHRKDFIDIFVLFIITLFNKNKYEYADTDKLNICEDFEAEFGFSIPYHPMISVLKRAKKHGYFTKSFGKYYPVWKKIELDDISEIAEEQVIKHQHIINEFLEFCVDEYGETLSKDDADKSFVSFLRDHDLDILFAAKEGSSVLPTVDSSAEHKFLMFNFITYVIESNPLVFSFIVAISIGHMIANTMLIRDYSQFQGNLKKAKVYLDTGFLFGVTGSNGIQMQEAYIEWVKLAQSQGVSLFVFRHTYHEFLSILDSCLHFMESRHFDPKKANRSLLNFRDQDWSASDVEEFIAHMDENLASLDIAVIAPPNPMKAKRYQINEEALEEIIINIFKARDPNFIKEEKGDSIYKDVKSITYVSKLRKGIIPRSLTQVRNVFVTTNSALAFASREYEHIESGIDFHYIPTAITDVFLGTLLWIRSPSKAKINEKRIAALAYAANIPNGTFREKIITKAKILQERGSISTDDVVLLTEDRMARNLLNKETRGNPNQLSDGKLVEVLERIKLEIRKEETESFNLERYTYEERLQKAVEKTQTVEEVTKRTIELANVRMKELHRIKEKLDIKTKQQVTRKLWGGFGLFILLWILLAYAIFHFGWGKTEPYLYLLGLAIPLFPYVYYIITKREWRWDEIYERMLNFSQMRNYSEVGFDLERYNEIQSDTNGN